MDDAYPSLREQWLLARARYLDAVGHAGPEDMRVLRDMAFEASEAVYHAEGRWPRVTDNGCELAALREDVRTGFGDRRPLEPAVA